MRVILDIPADKVTYQYKNPPETGWTTYITRELDATLIGNIQTVGFTWLNAGSIGILGIIAMLRRLR